MRTMFYQIQLREGFEWKPVRAYPSIELGRAMEQAKTWEEVGEQARVVRVEQTVIYGGPDAFQASEKERVYERSA